MFMTFTFMVTLYHIERYKCVTTFKKIKNFYENLCGLQNSCYEAEQNAKRISRAAIPKRL